MEIRQYLFYYILKRIHKYTREIVRRQDVTYSTITAMSVQQYVNYSTLVWNIWNCFRKKKPYNYIIISDIEIRIDVVVIFNVESLRQPLALR